MDNSRLGFFVNQVKVTDDEIQLQVKNVNGEKLEVALGVHVDPFSAEVTLHPIRHFTTGDSTAWFDDSMPWQDWQQLANVGVTRDH